MAKFAGSKPTGLVLTGPVQTLSTPTTRTALGAPGYERRDAQSELFLLAVTNMVGEKTFHENAGARDKRFTDLVHEVTVLDPDWLRRFLPWLRTEAAMRTASIQAAAEYVAAGGPNGRSVVASVLQRADEPGEMLAYFRTVLGVAVPKPVKRGIADSLTRLYTQNAVGKYDGQERAWNFGDVIELVHPTPVDGNQSLWFKYLVDRAHNPSVEVPAVFEKAARMRRINADEDATAEDAAKAGLDWTMASGKGAMDAKAWEAGITKMGYMALLRNLRNFSEAGISRAAQDIVISRLQDPDEVRRSMQFPYRFLSAYFALDGHTYTSALERAVDLSLDNVPTLPGRTLVMVDCSSSMDFPVTDQSQMTRVLVATVFAAGFQRKNPGCRVYGYGSNAFIDLTSTQADVSVLRQAEYVRRHLRGEYTRAWTSLAQVYDGEDRVVFITDEQTGDDPSVFPDYGKLQRVYVWNVAGYSAGMAGGSKVVTLGGYTDKVMTLVEMIDRAGRGDWPF